MDYFLPHDGKLEVSKLSHLFDNMSESYKLFWFQSILNLVSENKRIMSFDELVNEMIAEAWYMVSEYRLNLGPSDTLEALIYYTHQISGLKTNAKKSEILSFLSNSSDTQLKQKKRVLTYHVPYRLQAPFIDKLKGKDWNTSVKIVAEKINNEKRLLYYFIRIAGLESEIELNRTWQEYLVKNRAILGGWLQYNLIAYLQRRNPNVPGIVNKLTPPQERKLVKVKRYWKLICSVIPVRDIYSGDILSSNKISIDHFVPWSFVTHDELWNLSPTTKSINSSKSNQLAAWNTYFPRLCELEYSAYQTIWRNKKVRDEFEHCRREHINSNEALIRLYKEGLSKDAYYKGLEEILLPVYQSAYNMGFKEWQYGGK